jgi:hypothetical protein
MHRSFRQSVFLSAIGTYGLGALALLGLLAGLSALAHARTLARPTGDHVPGELVVKLRSQGAGFQAEAAMLSALDKALGPNAVVKLRKFATDPALTTIRIAHDADLARAIVALRAEPAVEFAEPNLLFHAFDDGEPAAAGASDLPNDPDLPKTWGIHNTGQVDPTGQAGKAGADIDVVPLWQEGFHGSSKILVAVIDTGMDWDHPDLKANLYTNPGEIAGNGVDDDHNGFIDDVHGWNFVSNTNDSRDDHDHGTHVSGTIGAQGNNGIGVAGVNWEVSLLPVKFLDSNGSGSLDAAVESINYARIMKAHVMSNSWGGGGYSDALKQAIQKASDAGVLFVAAAGNESADNDGTPTYPAGYDVPNVVSVAATDNSDKIASFSNYGGKTVHVAAPGVNVYSTVRDSKYNTFSGTSMATPHVSGIAALLWSANPGWSAADIKTRLIATSDPVQGLRRKVLSHGRVNAYNAFHDIVPPSQDPPESSWKNVSGTVESAHPYANSYDHSWTIQEPGAKYIRVHFQKVEVEANYDKVYFQTPGGDVVEDLTGTLSDYTTDYVKGDTAVIRLTSDASNNAYGFRVDRIQVIMN